MKHKKILQIAPFIMSFFICNFSFAQDCSELFFSEYVEGSGNNKGMEIYNPTDQIIDLSSYYVARFSNGAATYEAGGITQLQGFLQPYSTHFLANGQTTTTETSPACDPALQAKAQQLDHDYPAPTYMNGNDAIALYKKINGEYVPIDLFGIIGGGMAADNEGWTNVTDTWVYKNIYEGDEIVGKDSVFITNYIVPADYYWLPWTANHTLVRKPSVKKGITANPDPAFVVTEQWDTLAGGSNVWDSIGTHFCECASSGETKIIDKVSDNLFLVYPNPVADNYINISGSVNIEHIEILSIQGSLIKETSFTAGESEIRLDIANLPSGTYLVVIQTKESKISKKIVIQ
ncbi:MAG: T9SS type A sorting domain-containing protein [Bacteroidales bacterium]|nr:T9SS type A sorting domain-containing protein [Bacteroidales bacterium]MBN2820974.1 T9SS type A sorting domain-containing protein [Bacteroidales bacterium]